MPAVVSPKPPADVGVLDQEADCLGDLGRLDQSAQPRVGQDVLPDVFFPQHLDHRRVSEPRVWNTSSPVSPRKASAIFCPSPVSVPRLVEPPQPRQNLIPPAN